MKKYKVTNPATGESVELTPKTEIKFINGKFVEVPNYEKYWNVALAVVFIFTVLAFINVIRQM
jgi:hypothetical protein